jgi:hypothetical protein
MMAEVTLTLEEYEALRSMAHDNSCIGCSGEVTQMEKPVEKPKRKPSAYNRKYAAAFGKVKNKYMKKGGGWKKDGFKHAAAAARKMI